MRPAYPQTTHDLAARKNAPVALGLSSEKTFIDRARRGLKEALAA